MIRLVLLVRQWVNRLESLVGKFGKSRRTGGHSDQYSGWTSTISKAVLDGSISGEGCAPEDKDDEALSKTFDVVF